MTAAPGYAKKDGLATTEEIAENIGQILLDQPDLNMVAFMITD